MSDLVNDMIALAKELTGPSSFDLVVTVTQRTVTARDSFQKPTARSTTPRSALLEESRRLFRFTGGVEKQARHKLTLLEKVTIDAQNTDFVLPDGTVAAVLHYDGLADPAGGRYLTEVWLQ